MYPNNDDSIRIDWGNIKRKVFRDNGSDYGTQYAKAIASLNFEQNK